MPNGRVVVGCFGFQVKNYFQQVYITACDALGSFVRKSLFSWLKKTSFLLKPMILSQFLGSFSLEDYMVLFHVVFHALGSKKLQK